MPRHQQITTCRKSGGPISKFCSCEHCTLSVCAICGAYEGGLTTDCPGVLVDYDRQKEVYETSLDFTEERGWHQGEPRQRRAPRFTHTRLPPEPPHVDPRTAVAPTIDWTAVDRTAHLQHELAQKAIAWVLADRKADDHAATLTRLEDDKTLSIGGKLTQALFKQYEHEKISFRLASQRAEKCDDAFRQAARKLVAALEGACAILPDVSKKDPAPC